MSELSTLDLDPEMVKEMLEPEPTTCTGGWYDYLAIDREAGDMLLAQRWYGAFCSAAPIVGYRRRIRIMIHDGPPYFYPDSAMMAVPRAWEPSTPRAFALFVVVAGISPWTSLGAIV